MIACKESLMLRRNRQCPLGLPVHIVQRGNNRQVCFASDADMNAYANWLHEGADKFEAEVAYRPPIKKPAKAS
jgi:putative transposase